MTTFELGSKLREMYENAMDSNQVAMIHLFGILYTDEIDRANATNSEVIRAAGINSSYQTELSKGRKLSKFVYVKPEYLAKYKRQ